jgi:hypothetical protein
LYLIIGDFNFEGVGSFAYLGSVIENGNKMWKDIHSKIMTANRAYSAHIKLFIPKLLPRNTKLKNIENSNTTHSKLWIGILDNDFRRNECS